MVHLRFQAWYRRAVSQIIYIPDRIAAEQELAQHMEDRYEALRGQGYAHDEAEILTVQAMGDAAEVARELGLIHRPFWGLLQQRTRKAVIVVLAVIAALLWLNFTGRVAQNGYSKPQYSNFNPFSLSRYVNDAGHFDRVYHLTPGSTVKTDGFTVTATNVALWQYTPNRATEHNQPADTLYIQLKFFNPLPWAHHAGDVTNWFWAEDDLGNVYAAFHERTELNAPAVYSNYCQTGPFTYVHDLYLSECVSREAQWIELHYNRAGRDLVLRIDLTGGAA